LPRSRPIDAAEAQPRAAARSPTRSGRAAVRKIEEAPLAVLVLGAGANRKMTSRMLLQFIEKTGIPFITTQLGKGVIDELTQVPRLRRAVGRRLRPQGDRGRRPHHQLSATT
jgi:thiamine pyrophosphate-dependent acetolactate synthase large subunit-like protein